MFQASSWPARHVTGMMHQANSFAEVLMNPLKKKKCIDEFFRRIFLVCLKEVASLLSFVWSIR